MFKIHCQPLLWCCFFLDTSDNRTHKYAVKLKAFSTCYSLKGNDSMPDMFSSFLLPCIYHTIRYIQTEISLILMLSRKQTNVSPILPPNWKWCGIFHIFWFKVHHISGCRWKGLSTQCFMQHVTTLPAWYLVQHYRNFCFVILFFDRCILWL